MMTKSMAAALLFFSATSTESISLPGQYSLTMSWQAEISGKYYPYEKNCFYDIDGQQYLEKSQGSVTLELPYTGKAYSFSASGGWCNSWAFTSKIGPFPSMVGLTLETSEYLGGVLCDKFTNANQPDREYLYNAWLTHDGKVPVQVYISNNGAIKDGMFYLSNYNTTVAPSMFDVPAFCSETLDVNHQTCSQGWGPCVDSYGTCSDYVWESNVCACGTVYNDHTQDDGMQACCGDGCPTHRVAATAKHQTCSQGWGFCVDSHGTCSDYVLGSNVCACGTIYNDYTQDDGMPACCGNGCPTYRRP